MHFFVRACVRVGGGRLRGEGKGKYHVMDLGDSDGEGRGKKRVGMPE